MNSRKIFLSLTLGFAAGVMAQTADGGLSPQIISEIQKSHKMCAGSRALANAMASNSIDNLAQNHANAGELDTYFSVETPKQSITDQQSSGRCWMFSGFNVLRSNFAQRTDSLTTEWTSARRSARLSVLLGPVGESQSLFAGSD